MNLKDLIDELKKADQAMICSLGFNHPHSYRGYYHELAFEPLKNVAVRDMLASAKSALGTTYCGWKGGDFKMEYYTSCHLAEEGHEGEELGPILLGFMLAANADE